MSYGEKLPSSEESERLQAAHRQKAAEWSAALKAADPLGMYSKASADEIEAAREAGRQKFEESSASSAFKPAPQHSQALEMGSRTMSKELRESLTDASGRLDPKKLKKFASMLVPSDPWRLQIEADFGSISIADEDDSSDSAVQHAPPPPRAFAPNKTGEAEGGADGKTWLWEQTSTGDESEILVRFRLSKPATKKQVKVVFKVQSLAVTVAGEVIFDSKLHGKCYPDECTWSLAELTSSESYSSEIVHELQVLLSLAEDANWTDLCAK
jgi:hypothetical protein